MKSRHNTLCFLNGSDATKLPLSAEQCSLILFKQESALPIETSACLNTVREGTGTRATPVKNGGTATRSSLPPERGESAATVVPASQFPQAPVPEGGLPGPQAHSRDRVTFRWFQSPEQISRQMIGNMP